MVEQAPELVHADACAIRVLEGDELVVSAAQGRGAERKVVPYTAATDMDSPNPDSGEEYFHTNTQLFNSLDIGIDSTLNIINNDGILLAQKPYLQSDSIGKSFAARPNVVRILRDSNGNGSFNSISSMDYQQRLYTYSRVGNLPLTVIVALSSEEVFGAWRRTAILISGATGVLCAGLLWLTWLLAGRPEAAYIVERLIDAAGRAGGRDPGGVMGSRALSVVAACRGRLGGAQARGPDRRDHGPPRRDPCPPP